MRKVFIAQKKVGVLTALGFIFLTVFVMLGKTADARTRTAKAPPPEIIDVIIIGDRVVNIAYNLDVLPVAMSVRGSLWPMAGEIKTASQILGCPNHIVSTNKKAIPSGLKKFNVKRVIVEKNDNFCSYKPKVNPGTQVSSILKGLDVKIDYVDFSQGVESAIRQTAKLLNREEKADALIEEYNKNLAKAQKKLPKEKLGKKVLILSGTYQSDTGKTMVRVEAPGGYSDNFFLKPMGCINVGDIFLPENGKADKGHYPVAKKRSGFILDPMIEAKPDIIVITGNVYAVQKVLASSIKNNPAFADVPAIKNMAIYNLPFYVDSSVIEFPDMLRQWAVALTDSY